MRCLIQLLQITNSLFALAAFQSNLLASPTIPVLLTQAVAGKNAGGAVEVFALGANQAVYHKGQLSPNASAWSDWAPANGGGITQLAIGNSSNGGLVVAGLGSNHLVYLLQQAGDGSWPGSWTQVGSGQWAYIALGKQANGAIALFGIGTDQAVYWLLETSPGSGTFGLGWAAMKGGGIKKIAVTNEPNGALTVIGLGTNQATYYTRQSGANGPWVGSWTAMNGGGLADIAVAASGVTATFGIGSNQKAYWDSEITSAGAYQPSWSDLNGGGLLQIVAATQADGNFATFGLGVDQAVYWDAQGSGLVWQPSWSPLHGGGLKQITATSQQNGALIVIAVGSNGELYSDAQNGPNGDWQTSWTALSNPQLASVIRRIAGANYISFAKADPADGYHAANGVMTVTHNPGCAPIFGSGNDGRDLFFDAAGKPLPYGCTVISHDFIAFWPGDASPGDVWSFIDDAGSYGAQLQSPNFTVRWHNACTGGYGGKNLLYVISFLVQTPVGTYLEDDMIDPGIPVMALACKPPANFSCVPVEDGGYTGPSPGKPLHTYYFKITCSSEYNPCFVVAQQADTQEHAQQYLVYMNQGCGVTWLGDADPTTACQQ